MEQCQPKDNMLVFWSIYKMLQNQKNLLQKWVPCIFVHLEDVDKMWTTVDTYILLRKDH